MSMTYPWQSWVEQSQGPARRDIAFALNDPLTAAPFNFPSAVVLAANAVLTGTAAEGGGYRRVTGRSYSDQAGSLAIQESDDGVTWDTVATVACAAGTVETFDVELYLPQVRAVYTNGTVAQTVFRLTGWFYSY